MKKFPKQALLLIPALGLWSMDFSPQAPHLPTLATPAGAVMGRPLSPVSVAGVARRTTRRAVVATSSSSSQQQAAPVPAPATAAGPPAGTTVSALPPGCTSTVVDSVNLFNCSGVMYQPVFQSNNLVYVVK